jgi:hypothetical protein
VESVSDCLVVQAVEVDAPSLVKQDVSGSAYNVFFVDGCDFVIVELVPPFSVFGDSGVVAGLELPEVV